MTTTITAVQGTKISHALFIDLTLGNVTYYISSAYQPVTIDSNTYTELGAFLQIGDVTEDLKTTNGDTVITLSGIPSDVSYMDIVLSTSIKGGNVIVRRGFFDTTTLQPISGQIFERYRGIITNFNVEESTNFLSGELTNQISISCASLNSLLETQVRGQRTNETDRKRFYPTDVSFDRVKALQNTSFDFGKKYTGGGGYGGGGGFGPGGGGRDFGDFNYNER
jgi:hypothetical protein